MSDSNSDIILAMELRKRREFCIMGECLFFQAYEQTSQRISERYYKAAKTSTEEGIKMLTNITAQYLKSSSRQNANSDNTELHTIMASCSKMPFENKKELIEEEPPFLENTQNKRYYSFSKQAQPKEVSAVKSKKRMSEVEELNASLKKMVFEESEEHCYSDENIDSGNMEAMQGKSIGQLIAESNQKMEQRMTERENCKEQDDLSSEGSSYHMTDYSSNESSNENDYEEFIKHEEEPILSQNYKTISNISMASQSSIGSSYQPSKLMFSPKKDKSKLKRMYMNKKRIPRWAADLEKVNEVARQQAQNPDYNPQTLFGVCVVERLDTNVVFKTNDLFHRGSSAKWKSNPFQ